MDDGERNEGRWPYMALRLLTTYHRAAHTAVGIRHRHAHSAHQHQPQRRLRPRPHTPLPVPPAGISHPHTFRPAVPRPMVHQAVPRRLWARRDQRSTSVRSTRTMYEDKTGYTQYGAGPAEGEATSKPPHTQYKNTVLGTHCSRLRCGHLAKGRALVLRRGSAQPSRSITPHRW